LATQSKSKPSRRTKLIKSHLEKLDSTELNLLDRIDVLEEVNFELEESNTQLEKSNTWLKESNTHLLAQKKESIRSKNSIIKAFKQSNVRRNGYWDWKRSVDKKEEKNKGEFNCIHFVTAITHLSH